MLQEMLHQFALTAMFFVGLVGLAMILALVAIAAPIFGASSVRSLVQWINRRDDPRHEKRPPDPP